jgi:hypothetical protein
LLQEMGGKAVPQCMNPDTLGNARPCAAKQTSRYNWRVLMCWPRRREIARADRDASIAFCALPATSRAIAQEGAESDTADGVTREKA